MTEVDDYAETLIKLKSLTNELERALLHGSNEEAMTASIHLVNASLKLQDWCFRNRE